MKKIRYFPFGYRMANGQLEIVAEEGALVRKIFYCYLTGSSLTRLTNMAEQTGLKFRENFDGWNKNMIARILDDERYWSEEQFPPIISKELALKAIALKKSKAAPKSTLQFLRKKIICSHCGAPLHRNSKNLPRIYWNCQGCGTRIGPFTDAEFLHIVTEKFMAVCKEPQMVKPKATLNNNLSMQAARLTNEINQVLEQKEVDPSRVLPLILECAATKYKTCSIKESDHLTIKIKILFQNHRNDDRLDQVLFEQTVEQVILQLDGSVQLRLINQKIV